MLPQSEANRRRNSRHQTHERRKRAHDSRNAGCMLARRSTPAASHIVRSEDGDQGPLFPAWSTTVLRLCLAGIAIGVSASLLVLLAWERSPYVTGELNPAMQPVKFDHRHHVRDAGISCTYCHAEVTTSATAGIPASSVCMGCHAQIWSRSPELEPVRASYFSDAPLQWERVTRLPDFVFFNHAIHVNKGVGCATCHGRIDLMSQVYAVNPFTMKFCLDCHRAPEKYLRPPELVTDMEWTPDARRSAQGSDLRRQLHVQPGLDCTSCHR